jgi:imidazolonepropionase-like amidohydrolase
MGGMNNRVEPQWWVAILALTALVIMHAAPGFAAAPVRQLALTQVNIVDIHTGRIARNATILIEGNRIRRIAYEAIAIPAGARVVSLPNKFVMPGLWDMHVHSMLDERDPDWMFPLMLVNGVTGIRDMGSFIPLVRMLRLRADIESGQRLGPRMMLAGPIVDGFNTVWAQPSGIPDVSEAIRAVRALKEQGADFVKVFPLLGRDTYFAIVAEAKRLRIPIAGQVPEPVTAAEASDAGQRSIEHLERIILGCSDIEADVVAIKQEVIERLEIQPDRETLAELVPTPEETAQTLATVNPDRCSALLARFARNGTAVVPTLNVTNAYRFSASRLNDPRLATLPATIRDAWTTMHALMSLVQEDAAQLTTIEYLSRRLIVPMAEAGVPMLAGTHAASISPFIFPGASLHDELAALVTAGLTPLGALQTATIAPARFANQETDFGSVTVGALADLLVLDANPLDHISNTKRIHAVVTNGRLLDRQELDAMARRVARMPR